MFKYNVIFSRKWRGIIHTTSFFNTNDVKFLILYVTFRLLLHFAPKPGFPSRSLSSFILVSSRPKPPHHRFFFFFTSSVQNHISLVVSRTHLRRPTAAPQHRHLTASPRRWTATPQEPPRATSVGGFRNLRSVFRFSFWLCGLRIWKPCMCILRCDLVYCLFPWSECEFRFCNVTCFGRIECGWALVLVFHDCFGEILNFNVT